MNRPIGYLKKMRETGGGRSKVLRWLRRACGENVGCCDRFGGREGTLVTYIKKDVLYQYDVNEGEKTKICDVAYDISLGESVSEDGKVWYWDGEDTWYCWYQGGKEKVDSGDIGICYISENKGLDLV